MKGRPDVLHLCISDLNGGASKAAYRLHQSLNSLDVNSWMYVDHKGTEDPKVLTNNSWFHPYGRILRTRLDKLPLLFTKHRHWDYASFNFLPNRALLKAIRSIQPRMLHIHWMGDGFFPIHYFSRLDCRVVATLHSRWLFCGAQHIHADASKRFIDGFNSDNRDCYDGGIDVDRWVWERKKRHLPLENMLLIALSRWMKSDLERCFLFKNSKVQYLPNGIDTHLFSPKPILETREKLGLNPHGHYILFGANHVFSDPNKGWNNLEKALVESESLFPQNTELLIFGSDDNIPEVKFKMKCRMLGKISDSRQLSEYYAASDCFVLTSGQDNLPTTILESMASGTPCVAFRVGGVSDMIDSRINGYLVEPGNIEMLGQSIAEILRLNSDDHHKMRKQCRMKIVDDFSMENQAIRMKDAYIDFLGNTKLDSLKVSDCE